MRATGCQCLAPNGRHTIFLGCTHFKTKETGARAPLGANVWHRMGVTPFFCDTHIVKPKKQVHARHWVPLSGTQWVSHPVFSDAPFFWEPTGACAPLGANVWHPMGVLGYAHFKAQKTGRRTPLGANVWHPMGGTPSFF